MNFIKSEISYDYNKKISEDHIQLLNNTTLSIPGCKYRPKTTYSKGRLVIQYEIYDHGPFTNFAPSVIFEENNAEKKEGYTLHIRNHSLVKVVQCIVLAAVLFALYRTIYNFFNYGFNIGAAIAVAVFLLAILVLIFRLPFIFLRLYAEKIKTQMDEILKME